METNGFEISDLFDTPGKEGFFLGGFFGNEIIGPEGKTGYRICSGVVRFILDSNGERTSYCLGGSFGNNIIKHDSSGSKDTGYLLSGPFGSQIIYLEK